MLLTEEEAKAKWCPQAQIAAGPASNDIQTCCASNCMMWRWGKDNLMLKPPWTPADWTPPEGFRLREDGNTERIDSVGYCGLAGNPEE